MARAAEQIPTPFATDVPQPVADFLLGPSDQDWADAAASDLETLLIDHANCELKAASSALALMHRYPMNAQLTYRMSRLAREELRHFEQVSRLIADRGIKNRTVSAASYASTLRKHIASNEPQRLVDTLIIGAMIEARSCERFALIAPLLDAPLAKFYRGLLASESRHFEHYLALARDACVDDSGFNARVEAWLQREFAAINSPASAVRFHSGPPSV
ncbi:MAG: tRNA-(ms[2]io[6]A)-hydroxylase [Pseudomonadota bacterium]